MTQPSGEVYDIGYQHHTGEREGRNAARLALMVDGMRTSMGLGRNLVAKALPGVLVAYMLIAALVFIIIASFPTNIDIGVDDYYVSALIPLIVFSAIIAPELLTADRRSEVLALYLVRPISSLDYLLGRWMAFFVLSLAVVLIPQFLIFLGINLNAADAWGYLRDNWLDIPRFMVAGAALALFTTTIPLAAAAFTNRRAVAAAVVIGIWFIAAAVGNSLGDELESDVGSWLTLLDVGSSPLRMSDLIFDKPFEGPGEAVQGVPMGVLIAWYLALVAIPAALLWNKYRKSAA